MKTLIIMKKKKKKKKKKRHYLSFKSAETAIKSNLKNSACLFIQARLTLRYILKAFRMLVLELNRDLRNLKVQIYLDI
jgi:hypothetical protein